METKEVMMTPEMAKSLLRKNTRNVPLSKALVDYYASEMSKGHWMANAQTISVGMDGVLLDGQHRLWAVVKSGVTVPMLVATGVDPESFKTIDTGRTRPAGMLLSIEGVPDPNNAAGVCQRYFALHNGYIGHISSRTLGVSKGDIVDFVRKNKEDVNSITREARRLNDEQRMINVSLVGGYMLYLILDRHRSRTQVSDFFSQVCTGKGVTNNTIFLLRSRLIKEKTSLSKLPQAIVENLLRKTWNCYVTGREVRTLKFDPSVEDNVKIL